MPRNSSSAKPLEVIPSVDEILRTEGSARIESDLGRDAAVRFARETLDEIRRKGFDGKTREDIAMEAEAELRLKYDSIDRKRLRRVINATGVIVHTNLGRSPLSQQVVEAIAEASSYCNVELDVESGSRGRRGAFAEQLAAEITSAEDALIVNNCAAAALLTLSALGRGGEVIVSRGELVEIGGDFRIPDVLEQSGCRLREVGTTNRTKLVDYERAISGETKALLRVHPSNYRISGFTETPKLQDLAQLAHRHELPLIEDAGSGALVDLSEFGLGNEPVIADSIRSGADIVAFSGDKLFGGVQAGFLVGKRSLIEKIRKHPLYRAVRADKVVYAAVEATLRSFLRGAAFDDIPTLRMLSMKVEDIEGRAHRLKSRLEGENREGLKIVIEPGESAIGGGAGTGVKLETRLLVLRHSTLSADDLAFALRTAPVPVIARIFDDNVVLDLRTVNAEDEPLICDAIAGITVRNGSERKSPT